MRSLFAYQAAPWVARALFAALLAGLLFAVPAAQPQVSSALGRILTQQNISRTGDQSELPQIAYGGGQLAAAWGERSEQRVGLNGVAVEGSWPGAKFISSSALTAYQNPDVVVGSLGVTHMVYASGNTIYYRSRQPNGGYSAARRVASSNFPNGLRLALSSRGTLWAIWRDADGSAIYYKFSRDRGQTWLNGSDGGVVTAETGNMFAPDIAVGADDAPHVVWYMRSGGSYKGDIRIANWTGSRFASGRITSDGSGLYDADPSIVVDGQNVQHLVWRKQSGSNWVIFYARRAPGGSWQGYTPVATTRGDAKYAPAIGVDSQGTVSLTYSDALSGNARRIMLFSKLPGKSWEGPLALSGGRWDSHSDVVNARSATGIVANVVHQHEVGSDDGEIIYSRVLLKSCQAGARAETDLAQPDAAQPDTAAPAATGSHKLYFSLTYRSVVTPAQPGC